LAALQGQEGLAFELRRLSVVRTFGAKWGAD
jgi:hypothetical protein